MAQDSSSVPTRQQRMGVPEVWALELLSGSRIFSFCSSVVTGYCSSVTVSSIVVSQSEHEQTFQKQTGPHGK
ncbi:hypothetical protein AKJ16_DCAP10017 [Drosera capensis]